jgi:uncharacterized repeat protein (TIGR01451 family)
MKLANRLWILGLVAVVIGLMLIVVVAGVGAEQRADAGPKAAGEVQSTVLLTTADSTLNAWYPNQVLGTDGSMELRSGGVSRPVMQFDLSDVDYSPSICLCQATLRVYVKSRSNPSTMWATAYAITRPWTSSAANWLRADVDMPWQRGGASGAEDRWAQPGETTIHRVNDWVEIDVTEIVKRWLDGQLPNNGLMLEGRAGTSVAYVLSSADFRDPSLAPQLVVNLLEYPTPDPGEPVEPILKVVKTGPAGPLLMGGYYTITYNIQVTNPSAKVLSGVVLTDVMPLGTQYLGNTGGGVFDADKNTVVWALGEMAAGGSQSVTMSMGVLAWVREKGTLINLARATHAGEGAKVSEGSWTMPIVVPTVAPSPTPQRLYLPNVYQP